MGQDMVVRRALVLLLVYLSVSLAGPLPALANRANARGQRPAPVKVYPYSLWFREQVFQQIRLTGERRPPFISTVLLAHFHPNAWEERATHPPFAAVLLSLIAQLQL
jgi:hypothetical protein